MTNILYEEVNDASQSSDGEKNLYTVFVSLTDGNPYWYGGAIVRSRAIRPHIGTGGLSILRRMPQDIDAIRGRRSASYR
jgi:hypothetical protein